MVRLATSRFIASAALLALAAAMPALAQKPVESQPIALGAPVAGALIDDDGRLDSGEFYDHYVFAGRRGQRVTIDLTSSSFDPYLFIRGPEGFAEDNDDAEEGNFNARLVVELPANGEYRIAATSYEPGERGDYRIAMAEGGLATAAPVSERGPVAVPFEMVAIAIGDDRSGELAAGDVRLDSGEFYDRYTVSGRAGQRLTVDMISDDFDTYLFVRGPDGSGYAIDNDDAEEGNLNARLQLELPADGDYMISATSYAPGDTGRYALTIAPGATALTDPDAATSEAIVEATPADRVQTSGALSFGRETSGELGDGANVDAEGRYFTQWNLEGRSGERVSLAMRSEDFDATLAAVMPDGRTLTNDDDNVIGETTDSRLVFAMPAGGVTVRASSFRPGDTGAFTLIAEPATGARGGPADEIEARPIAIGQTVAGALGGESARTASGKPADRYVFIGRRGQRVDLRANSDDFDTMLAITGPGGFAMANDDEPEGETLDSRILTTLPADGSYSLQVTSYARVANGDYELVAGLNRSGEADTPIPATRPARIGEVVQGRLDRGAEQVGDSYVSRYSFIGQRGQPVTVDLSSEDFDTIVTLTTPSGEQQIVDDTGDSLDSRLERVLGEDGPHSVMVSSFGEGSTGAYRLALSEGTSRIPANPTPRRVFLFAVGISDYAGNSTNLDDTDHDAEKLAEKLREQGLLAPESVVLTNQEATPQAFEARFREVASRAGPNDIFMFFYSGHGDQIDAAADRRELDGRDETLVLADGSDYSDDRLAALFRSVNSGLSLVVLDSCFSGGFAQDVVTRPNVMGLFASEEDLTSLVAGELGAGGYLARFLNDGLGGSADGNGDRNLTAGEIVNYLRYRYRGTCAGAFCLPTETGDAQQGFQELIVQRGSVEIDDILFVLPTDGVMVGDD